MKRFVICLFALTAISTVALASRDDQQPCDANACMGLPHKNAVIKVDVRAAAGPVAAEENFEKGDHPGGRSQGRAN